MVISLQELLLPLPDETNDALSPYAGSGREGVEQPAPRALHPHRSRHDDADRPKAPLEAICSTTRWRTTLWGKTLSASSSAKGGQQIEILGLPNPIGRRDGPYPDVPAQSSPRRLLNGKNQ